MTYLLMFIERLLYQALDKAMVYSHEQAKKNY